MEENGVSVWKRKPVGGDGGQGVGGKTKRKGREKSGEGSEKKWR